MPFPLNISGNMSFSEAAVYLVCSGRKQTKYGHVSCKTEVSLISENVKNFVVGYNSDIIYCSIYRPNIESVLF